MKNPSSTPCFSNRLTGSFTETEQKRCREATARKWGAVSPDADKLVFFPEQHSVLTVGTLTQSSGEECSSINVYDQYHTSFFLSGALVCWKTLRLVCAYSEWSSTLTSMRWRRRPPAAVSPSSSQSCKKVCLSSQYILKYTERAILGTIKV